MKCARCTESEISSAVHFIYRVRMQWCHNHCHTSSLQFHCDKCITCMCIGASEKKKSSINLSRYVTVEHWLFFFVCDFRVVCFCGLFHFHFDAPFLLSHLTPTAFVDVHRMYVVVCKCVHLRAISFRLKFSFYMMFHAVYSHVVQRTLNDANCTSEYRGVCVCAQLAMILWIGNWCSTFCSFISQRSDEISTL